MEYVIKYRGYEIFRNDPNKPFQLRKEGSKSVLRGEFRDFAEARREVDHMKRGGLI